MMNALLWLKDRWYIPAFVLFVAVVALIAIFTRRKDGPQPGTIIKEVSKELEVIEAGAEVRRVKAELGAEKAKQLVEERYRAERARLDAEKERQAHELEEDPVALARFLVKAGKS